MDLDGNDPTSPLVLPFAATDSREYLQMMAVLEKIFYPLDCYGDDFSWVWLPANFFLSKSVSDKMLPPPYLRKTFKFWKFLHDEQRDENGRVWAPPHLADPTEENLQKWKEFIQTTFKAAGKEAKAAYEKLVVAACKADGFLRHNQAPQNIKDVLAIYGSKEMVALFRTNRSAVFAYGFRWFQYYLQPANLFWLEQSFNEFAEKNGMRVTLTCGVDTGARKRKHSIYTMLQKMATNHWTGEVKKVEKKAFKAKINLEGPAVLGDLDPNFYEIVDLPSELTVGGSRRAGNRFLVQHLREGGIAALAGGSGAYKIQLHDILKSALEEGVGAQEIEGEYQKAMRVLLASTPPNQDFMVPGPPPAGPPALPYTSGTVRPEAPPHNAPTGTGPAPFAPPGPEHPVAGGPHAPAPAPRHTPHHQVHGGGGYHFHPPVPPGYAGHPGYMAHPGYAGHPGYGAPVGTPRPPPAYVPPSALMEGATPRPGTANQYTAMAQQPVQNVLTTSFSSYDESTVAPTPTTAGEDNDSITTAADRSAVEGEPGGRKNDQPSLREQLDNMDDRSNSRKRGEPEEESPGTEDHTCVEFEGGKFKVYRCMKATVQDCEDCTYVLCVSCWNTKTSGQRPPRRHRCESDLGGCNHDPFSLKCDDDARYFTEKWRDQHREQQASLGKKFCLPLHCAECEKDIVWPAPTKAA